MAEVLLSVGFAGPHVSIQDPGRPGWLRYGVPGSGPMDRLALAAANLALGNAGDAPVIEISRGGLVLDCLAGEIGFALAGGGFILEQGTRRAGSWSLGVLYAGERLRIRPGPWGSWSCLALAGRLDLPLWLGSYATHAASGFGGGRLSPGMELRFHAAGTRASYPRKIPCPVFARPRRLLHVTPGPQERFFAPDALEDLLAARWSVTDAADRMGVRLAGPRLMPLRLDMPSEPLMRGAVQIAGDGVATVLMADHQTTGGYPKLAALLDCDLDGFAQLRPGDVFGFRAVDQGEAIALSRSRAKARAAYLSALAEAGDADRP